ncbi:MAG: glycosyltransferase [Methylobacteriaceae bacterium]|nr:glycosyltransferase [Methylobacteriaceae bacterium]HPG04872.1 glycosyltransferase [Rhodoblastus sp.]
MSRVVYDLSRLTTRVLNPTPNGIDWIDRLLADHFLRDRSDQTQSLMFGPAGPRVFAPGLLQNPTDALVRQWDAPPAAPDLLVEALLAPISRGRAATRLDFAPPGRARRIAGAISAYGLKRGANPVAAAPPGAIYLNATHYPLESARHAAWLDARPDIRPVFFIHDLLPVATPDTFWRGEAERHKRRLELLARRGAAALVTSRTVADALAEHMQRLGRQNLPIFQSHPPVAPIFGAPCQPDPRLQGTSYFVTCGTIEPRKNHALLVDVWRRFVAEQGPSAPKLVVVGKRGWNFTQIVEALADPALGGAVIEVAGLSNGGWRALLAGAAALLAPSFAEGYGLPLAEALTAGAPALCSNIAPFQEIGGEAAIYLDPRLPGEWAARIMDFAAPGSAARAEALRRVAARRPVEAEVYLADLDAFLADISRRDENRDD